MLQMLQMLQVMKEVKEEVIIHRQDRGVKMLFGSASQRLRLARFAAAEHRPDPGSLLLQQRSTQQQKKAQEQSPSLLARASSLQHPLPLSLSRQALFRQRRAFWHRTAEL